MDFEQKEFLKNTLKNFLSSLLKNNNNSDTSI